VGTPVLIQQVLQKLLHNLQRETEVQVSHYIPHAVDYNLFGQLYSHYFLEIKGRDEEICILFLYNIYGPYHLRSSINNILRYASFMLPVERDPGIWKGI
jgi:hypothetical protein